MTTVQLASLAALFSTAASTRWTCKPSAKARFGVGAVDDGPHEVGYFVSERVVIPEAVPGRPPRRDIWVDRFGGQDATKAVCPCRSAAPSRNHSSFMASKSNDSEPCEPLSSIRSAFLRPVAMRVASKVASAGPSSRA